MRASTVVACAVLVCSTAGAQDLVIQSADPTRSGEGEETFPAASPIESYEGGWKNGKAEGAGLVRVRLGDQMPTVPHSIIPSKREMLVLTNFSAGVASGDVHADYTEGFFTQTTDVKAGGAARYYKVDGQEVAAITPLAGEEGSLVRLMQYRAAGVSQPSRIFFGKMTSEGVTGEWADVPWFADNGAATMVGFGPYLEQELQDGSRLSCKFEPRDPDPANLIRDLMGQSGNPVVTQATARFDRQILKNVGTCTAMNANGWTFVGTIKFAIVPEVKFWECRTPSGKSATLIDGIYCREKKKKNQDVFSNIGQEFRRFVDRRVVSSINKLFGSMERTMCRATGTEPGKNCHINAQFGASWPVGDEPATGLGAEESAIRQDYVAANVRARKVAFDKNGALGIAAATDADLNALCAALCATRGQREYSKTLLSDLEAVASQSVTDDSIARIGRINRETASVLSGGLRLLIISGSIASAAVPLYRFGASAQHGARIQTAIDLVGPIPSNATFADIRARSAALQTLETLRFAHLQRMTVEGTKMLAAPLKGNIRILKGFPEKKATMLYTAISIGKTAVQVEDFIKKYEDVSDEQQLYDAIIREALEPLGQPWPPAQKQN